MSDSVLSTSSNSYRCKFRPDYKPPNVIGFFSLDGKGEYHNDSQNLQYVKYLGDQNVAFDLNLDMDKTIHKSSLLDPRLTHFLKFLLDNESRLNFPLSKSFNESRFYTYRGSLKTICCTPYENQDSWKMVATLYRGDIYLAQVVTEEKRMKVSMESERDVMMTSWGHKFEQFMISDSPNSKPDLSHPLNAYEEFNLIFQTSLNDHKLVFGAEMDGILCNPDTEPLEPNMAMDDKIQYFNSNQFVELKTSLHIYSERQNCNFRRFKARNWWAQSYLVGIEKIICGFRNNKGVVEYLQAYNLADLPQDSKNYWCPNVCINFLDKFLTFVKSSLEKKIIKTLGNKYTLHEADMVSLSFEYRPNDCVRIVEFNPETDVIVPDWFTKQHAPSSTDQNSDKPSKSDQNNRRSMESESGQSNSTSMNRNQTRATADQRYQNQTRATADQRYQNQTRATKDQPNQTRATTDQWNHKRTRATADKPNQTRATAVQSNRNRTRAIEDQSGN